jgi:hypothetical protein
MIRPKYLFNILIGSDLGRQKKKKKKAKRYIFEKGKILFSKLDS